MYVYIYIYDYDYDYDYVYVYVYDYDYVYIYDYVYVYIYTYMYDIRPTTIGFQLVRPNRTGFRAAKKEPWGESTKNMELTNNCCVSITPKLAKNRQKLMKKMTNQPAIDTEKCTKSRQAEIEIGFELTTGRGLLLVSWFFLPI